MIIKPRWTLVALTAAASSAVTWNAATIERPQVAAVVARPLAAPRIGSPGSVRALPMAKSDLASLLGGVALNAAAKAESLPGPTPAPARAATASLPAPAPARVEVAAAPAARQHEFEAASAELDEFDELSVADEPDEAAGAASMLSVPSPFDATRVRAGEGEIERLTRVLQTEPENVSALNNLAVIYCQRPGMTAFSEAMFGLLESLAPANETVTANLAAHRMVRSGKPGRITFGVSGGLKTLSLEAAPDVAAKTKTSSGPRG